VRLMGRVHREELQPYAGRAESKTYHIRMVDQFVTVYQTWAAWAAHIKERAPGRVLSGEKTWK